MNFRYRLQIGVMAILLTTSSMTSTSQLVTPIIKRALEGGLIGFSIAEAHPFNLPFLPGVIQNSCTLPQRPATSKVGREIEQLIQNFRNLEDRIKNPQAFVDALDEVLLKTKLAPILKCRDKLKAKTGLNYELRFQDPSLGNQAMNFGRIEERSGNGTNLKQILEFNLVKGVGLVIFVYLHELTHVCQAMEMQWLSSLYSFSKDENFIRNYVQMSMLGEIEAFYVMTLAFSELSAQAPGLCHEPNAYGVTLGTIYQAYEKALLRGHFAQQIVYDYASLGDDSSNWYAQNKKYLVQISSPETSYPYVDPPGKTFKLGRLDPSLIELVMRLGILVRE